MKFSNMKKVIAVAMAAVMTVGSVSMTPPVEVMAEGTEPAISAQVALDKKGAKLTWNKLEDAAVTGYRVYRTELVTGDDGAAAIPQAIATLDANGNSAKTWKFDFGANEEVTEEGAEAPISCLAEGYTSVSQENAYYSAEQGYGFTTGIPTAEGGTLTFSNRTDGKNMSEDVLNGDFATIAPPEGGALTAGGAALEAGQSYMEFVVDVPNGSYKVSATHSGFVTGRNISVFWFQGVQADRHAVNNTTAVSERTVSVTDGKLRIAVSASASGGTVYPPALSAVTVTEITKIQTGINSEGLFYCKDVTVDLSKDYTYKVVAMKGETEAADLNSGEIPTIPAPTVSVSATTTNSATLAINNNEVETDSYNIYRKKAADASFTKVAEFKDINAEGNYTASSVWGEAQVYKDDDFNSYTIGDGTTNENMRNLLVPENGDWTVTNPNNYYVGMVVDRSNSDCENNTLFLKMSALENYDGSFMYLSTNLDNTTTFHKKLADAAALNGQVRLQLNFALPDHSNKANTNRGLCSSYLYLADKEITENDAASGYVAKLEYDATDNKIYLNDSEVYDFGEGGDKVRSVWNTITLDVSPAEKKISYEFEREAEEYVKSGSVTIPDVPQEPAAQEGEEEPAEPSYATLSFTGAKNPSNSQRWANIAIDNLRFASLGEVGQVRTYTYTDNNLESDTEYNYYVGAVVDGKEIVRSSAVSGKTQPIVADSVSLSEQSLEIKKGDTSEALVATVLPENTSDKSVTWSSEDTSIATVENGVVTGVAAGTVNIVATTKNGMTASCAVTVTDVKLSKSSLSLKIGDEAELTATVLPNTITTQTVRWASDKEDVATVDENGKVKAIAAGTAKITVTADNNGETATCTVRVSKVGVTGITLNAVSGSLKKGEKVTLTPTVAPDNATNKDITWSTSNNKVATVDNGVVTAVGQGTAVITATSVDNAAATATYNVTVTDPATGGPATKVPATSVSIKKPSSTTLNKGKTLTLVAIMAPANATDTLTWKTSNPKVATVTAGKVKAVNKGTATITVTTTSGKKASIKVTVKIPAKKVKLSKKKATLKVGKTLKLKATLTPANATDKLTWKTSNKKVATVKNGKVKAKKKGKVTITVKTQSGKTAKCKITVK